MAITTLDGIVGGFVEQIFPFTKSSITTVAGGYFSLWAAAGQPGLGSLSIGNTTTGLIPTDATDGAFPFTNSTNSYLARAAAGSSSVGTLIIYDRLWHAGSFTSSNGTINATDSTPIDRDSTGAGAEIWVEIATALSAVATTITLTYTNQAGTGSRTATCVVPASAIINRMFPFTMAAGDTGIRSIENVAGSAAPTGTLNLVILRRLACIPMSVAAVFGAQNFAGTGFPRIYDNACIAMMMNSNTTTSGTLMGSFKIAQG
jgi:hypothetical protein